jgi:hypothetical protein
MSATDDSPTRDVLLELASELSAFPDPLPDDRAAQFFDRHPLPSLFRHDPGSSYY